MCKIRLMPLLLAIAALLTLTVPAAAYSDTDGHWAKTAIEKWSGDYGVLLGYDDGTFRPDSSITRGAFAVILNRFLQYGQASPSNTFSDTPGTWCEDAVLKLNKAGVMLGDGGKAQIGSTITRQEAVTMIARAFSVEGKDTNLSYGDASSVSDYAKGYVAAMTERGFISDAAGDRFRPRDAITRAEIVNILNNMVDELYQTSGTYEKDVDGTLMINAAGGAVLHDMTVTGDLILAPGVTGAVTLSDVTVVGTIYNLSQTQPVIISSDTSSDPTSPLPEYPDEPEYIDYKGKQIAVLPGVEKSGLNSDDFYWDGNRLNCSSAAYTTRFGIDVSSYQGTVDWGKAAADGVDFAFVRIGGRGTTTGGLYTDTRYAQNLDGAMAAGIDTGAYFFAQAITVDEAKEEAAYVLSLLQGHTISGPVVYDWEMLGSGTRTYGIDPSVATACARAFCDALSAAGYGTMVYFTDYVGYTKYDLSQLNDSGFWYANYSYAYPNFYYQVDYWQYSSKGSVAGISGNVDCNLQFIPKS